MKVYKLAENTIDNKDYKVLINFLKKRKYLNQSKVTKTFEKKFSSFLGSKLSTFVNSGSSANLLMAQTLLEGNFLKNKTAILPAVSWSTTVSPFLQLGFKVILCDCDKIDLGLCPIDLERICKRYNPGLIVVVNVLGHSNDFKKIMYLRNKYNFKLVEDNCESLGSYHAKRNLGTFGLASSHSFYFGHHMTTIEGGMVCTDDEKLFEIMKSKRSHGFARETSGKTLSIFKGKYPEIDPEFLFITDGYNFRNHEI